MPLFSLNSPSNRPEVDIEGSMTNPRDKRCRKSLRPWHDFPEEQEPGTLYDTFPTESRVFEDRNFPAGLGNRTRREDPRASECRPSADVADFGGNAFLFLLRVSWFEHLRGSFADSARCDRSARHNQAQCDVQCLTSVQPCNIGAKHSKVQDELDAAEQELQRAAARIRRYRKQKKL
ncbi:hypothetical protein PG987_004812 [Apiospora arundinis]